MIVDPENYNLVLYDTGEVQAKADCNTIQGTYEIIETELTFEFGPYTPIACPEGSLSSTYMQLLTDVNKWEQDEEGQLALGSGPGQSTANILVFNDEGPAPTPTP